MVRRSPKSQRLLACLGDPSRFRLVSALSRGERCVSDLANAVGLSQSCTTRHLQVLSKQGLVRGERAGKRVLFRLVAGEPEAQALIAWALNASSHRLVAKRPGGAASPPTTPTPGGRARAARSKAFDVPQQPVSDVDGGQAESPGVPGGGGVVESGPVTIPESSERSNPVPRNELEDYLL